MTERALTPSGLVSGVLLVLGATVLGLPAFAQEHRAAGSVLVYADDDAVTVISPAMDGHLDLHPVSVDAHYQVDVVSAASVDLVTSASPRGFSELRHQASGDFELDFGRGTRASAGYGTSVEPDYVGHGVSAGLRGELWRRQTTMDLGYALQLATVGRARDPSFAKSRTGHEVALTWSQILDRASVVDVSANLTAEEGALENPYRFVRIYEAGAVLHTTAVAESAPARRLGLSGMGRFRTQLHPRVFGLIEAQLHQDTWAVLAATGRLQGRLVVVPNRLLLTLEGRGYWQRPASFYARRYESFPQLPRYRTSDKELGPMWTALGGIDLEWSPPVSFASALRFGLGLDLYYMRYLDHPVLAHRTATIGTFDVELAP